MTADSPRPEVASMPRVVHFEFGADDPERAARFWGEAFGWEIDRWPGGEYWLAKTGEGAPGIDGAIIPRGSLDPAPGALLTVLVDSVEEAVAKVQQAGGTLLGDKHEIPGVGWFAHCRDTEGSVFSVMQATEGAAPAEGSSSAEGAAGGAAPPGATA